MQAINLALFAFTLFALCLALYVPRGRCAVKCAQLEKIKENKKNADVERGPFYDEWAAWVAAHNYKQSCMEQVVWDGFSHA